MAFFKTLVVGESEMKKTSALLFLITIICLLMSSCQTTAAPEESAVQVAPQPVVRTIDNAHFTSFGFEFDLQVNGSKQLAFIYPSTLSSDLMSEYASFFAGSSDYDYVRIDADKNSVIVGFRQDLTDDEIKNVTYAFASGSYSFEAFLNNKFDSIESPVYTIDAGSYVLYFKQVGSSEIIVDFPGIPDEDAALAVLQTAAAVSPVVLDGTDIYMSSGNRVLYILPAVFDPAQFKSVVESIISTEEASVSAPSVTSEPVAVVQIPTIPSVQPQPVSTAPTASTAPSSPTEPSAPAEQGQTPSAMSPGLIMLIIVLLIVAVTCVVAIVKRKTR